MKMKFVLTVLASLAASGLASAATNDLTTLLQRGLFEEEADHQLDAAIGDYKEAIEQFDHQRQLAATAIFRLGECYRKLGRTNEANAQYERIVREFPDQTQLAQLSHAYLPANSGATAASDAGMSALPPDEDKFLREVKESVQNSPDLVNQQLEKAAANGYVSAAEYLIAHGADVSLPGPMVSAAKKGNEAMVQLLLSHGAAVDSRDGDGSTALSHAARNGFMTLCRTLVGHGADVNAKNDQDYTPLCLAVNYGQLAAAEFLVTNKAHVDVRSRNNGMTPLTSAIQKGETDMVKLLLDNHADANMGTEPPNGPYSPLTLGIDQHDQMVQLLLDHGAKPNAVDINGDTALVDAVKQGNMDVIRILVEHGADVNAADKGGSTPLHWAVVKGNLSAAAFLIANKAQIDATTSDGFTPLAVAIIHYSSEEMVKLLLDNHADANLETGTPNDRRSPLRWAIDNNHPQTVQLLLEHGANPNAIDSNGNPPLMDAFKQGNVDMVRLLIDHGADVNSLDKQGRPPLAQLRSALAERDRRPFGLPPGYQAPGVQPGGFYSPVDNAAPKIEELLLEAGADPNYNRRLGIWTYGEGGTHNGEIFHCASNSINHYTLLEFLAALYNVDLPLGISPRNYGDRSVVMGNYSHYDDLVRFPDFARISIHRLEGKRPEILHVNVAEILQSGDCSKDVALQAGDQVEIARKEHKVADQWHGLPEEDDAALNKCLTRMVQIISQGHTNSVALAPSIADAAAAHYGRQDSQRSGFEVRDDWLAEVLKGRKADTVVRSFLLADAVRDPNVLLNTWDLSRVRLTRGGAKMTFDLTANPAPDVWLENGDVIEIPELGEAAPATETK